MATKGVLRRFDGLGRIVIPIEMRRAQRLYKDSMAEITMTKDGILIKAPSRSCAFCGKAGTREFEGRWICEACRKKLREELLGGNLNEE